MKRSIDLAFREKKFSSKQKKKLSNLKTHLKMYFLINLSIERIGVYVPGGTASYPSTVLMNCIPALVVGGKIFI